MKKKLLIVVLILGAVFAFSSIASAAWYEVTVNEAGIDPTTGITFVNLTYVSGPSPTWTGGRWYIATGENAKAMLAVGLSAVSMGAKATASLDSVEEWATVSGLFMKGQ
jgi:hypothetical protein